MVYKTAIVTGASRGLGRAIALAIAKRGLNVMLASRSEPELTATLNTLKSAGLNHTSMHLTDMRSVASIQRLFDAARETFGIVDVLVNNAGVGTYKPFVEWTDQEVEDTIQVNLTGLMRCCSAALPQMIAQRRGFIINIASDLSRKYLPNMAPYVASKFGVLGFSSSLLREVKQHSVKVCTVLPGIIDTSFNNSQEGSREETWALRPAYLADQIAALLDLPEHVIIDELTIHPMHQDF